jgi:hypothetical protein
VGGVVVVVASYPLSSQAPTPVEVELGCDNSGHLSADRWSHALRSDQFYLPPYILSPLDNDVEGNGKPSDHLIIVMKPISQSDVPKPKQKVITFRPLPESGMLVYNQWLQTEMWQELYQVDTAHQKAEMLHTTLLQKLDLFLPMKTIKIRNDDHPWVTSEIMQLDRLFKREYSKRKRSDKWTKLNVKYELKCEKAKKDYAKNIVNDLKYSNQSQWYSKIKRMSSHNLEKDGDSEVEELVGIPDQLKLKE